MATDPVVQSAQSGGMFGVAVGLLFWATGAGKSLVYQLPALTTGKVSLVVSPLISLMTDQVAALNHMVGGGKEIGCFLGSSQMDGSIESRALSGEFRVVYLTPEKLYTGFLERLQPLVERGAIGTCGYADRKQPSCV